MSVYYQKYKAILELNRTVNGQEENLDEEETTNDTAENDEHATDDDDANDYNSDLETDEENNEDDFEEPNDNDNTSEEDDEHATDDDANDYNSDLETDDENTEEDDENTEEDDENTEEDDENTEESNDELKQIEDNLFKSLPPEQMVIKVTELKKQYLDVYNTISNTLIRTNKIVKTNENIKVLEFVTNKLIELKEMVNFYMANTFDTKSFIENNINYQQYLATLNTINKIFKEIQDKKEDK